MAVVSFRHSIWIVRRVRFRKQSKNKTSKTYLFRDSKNKIHPEFHTFGRVRKLKTSRVYTFGRVRKGKSSRVYTFGRLRKGKTSKVWTFGRLRKGKSSRVWTFRHVRKGKSSRVYTFRRVRKGKSSRVWTFGRLRKYLLPPPLFLEILLWSRITRILIKIA